jgi:hypothetical protein
MLKQAVIILAAILFLASMSAAQDEGHFDASINYAGVFTKTANGNAMSQSATIGGDLFGTIRVKFNSKNSLAFNFGRAKNSQIYQSNFDFHVVDTITENSVDYIYSPYRKGRFHTFVLAGGGALRFRPRSTWVVLPNIEENGVSVPNRVQTNLGASTQTQFAFLYGGGVDYLLPWLSRFALRLQYRGFVYSAPDFNVTSGSSSSVSFFTGSRTNMAEPSVGLVFRF